MSLSHFYSPSELSVCKKSSQLINYVFISLTNLVRCLFFCVCLCVFYPRHKTRLDPFLMPKPDPLCFWVQKIPQCISVELGRLYYSKAETSFSFQDRASLRQLKVTKFTESWREKMWRVGGEGGGGVGSTERWKLALPKFVQWRHLKGVAAHHAPGQRIPPPHAAPRSHLLRGAEASSSIQ